MPAEILETLRAHDYRAGGIGRELALAMESMDGPDVHDLMAIANRVRHELLGPDVHLCGIINAKSGHCTEDCTFCSQSTHYSTGIKTYPYLPTEQVVEGGRLAASHGAKRYGIVTAQRDLKPGKMLDKVLDSLRAVTNDGAIQADASLGLIEDVEVAHQLRAAGLVEVNHNLETSRRFFPEVCTTHTYDDRIQTLKHAKAAGIRLCSGGVFGMGETWEDRVDLAMTLLDIGVDTVPLNFLHRMEGTPLANLEPLPPMEILKIIAMYRLVLPWAEIKIGGGREANLRSLQPLMFAAGANSIMVGNYLTTSGWNSDKDHEMIRDMGLRVATEAAPAASAAE